MMETVPGASVGKHLAFVFMPLCAVTKYPRETQGAGTYFSSQFQRCPSIMADKGMAGQFHHGGQEVEKREKSGWHQGTHDHYRHIPVTPFLQRPHHSTVHHHPKMSSHYKSLEA